MPKGQIGLEAKILALASRVRSQLRPFGLV